MFDRALNTPLPKPQKGTTSFMLTDALKIHYCHMLYLNMYYNLFSEVFRELIFLLMLALKMSDITVGLVKSNNS